MNPSPALRAALLSIVALSLGALPSQSFAGDFTTTSAASSSAYPGWPASAVHDQDTGTSWSSSLHASSGSTEWIAYWWSQGLQSTNYVKVLPRYQGSNALCFPVSFTIYYSNGSQWVQAATYNNYANPAYSSSTGGWITLPLPATYLANGIMISATALRSDGTGNHAFQLAEARAGFDSTIGASYTCPPEPYTGGLDAVPATDWASRQGSGFNVSFGINRNFGGVGAEFYLENTDSPGNRVQILENRSLGGAGWQTAIGGSISGWGASGSGIEYYNQSSGNSVGYQWGVKSSYVVSGTGFAGTAYLPMHNDMARGYVSGTYGTSPCLGAANPAWAHEDGKLTIASGILPTAHGDAVAITHLLSLRSRNNQSWNAMWRVDNAFYANKPNAVNGNLRVYIKGKGGWTVGPLFVSNNQFHTSALGHAACGPFPEGGQGWACNFGSLFSSADSERLEYVVLVWNIFGKDIGIALPQRTNGSGPNPGFGIILHSDVYCSNPDDKNCGNVSFHSIIEDVTSKSIPEGAVRNYQQDHRVGTLPQLADMGFATW